jgi:hypothetical protein
MIPSRKMICIATLAPHAMQCECIQEGVQRYVPEVMPLADVYIYLCSGLLCRHMRLKRASMPPVAFLPWPNACAMQTLFFSTYPNITNRTQLSSLWDLGNSFIGHAQDICE